MSNANKAFIRHVRNKPKILLYIFGLLRFYIDKKEKHIQFIYQLQIPLHYHNKKKTIIGFYIGIKQITLAAVKFTNLHRNVNDDYQENYHDDSKVNVIYSPFFNIFFFNF